MLQDFLSLVRTDGLARSNRFSIVIPLPASRIESTLDLERLSLFAEISTLPGAKINTEQLKLFGPVYTRPTGIDYGNTINVTFIVDGDLKVRRIFEDWIHLVGNKNSYTVNYHTDYVSQQITLSQLNVNDNIVYTYKLKDAFPIEIGAMNISQQTENQVHRLTVTFAYRSWEYMQVSSPQVDWTKRMANNITAASNESSEKMIEGTTPLSNDTWYSPDLYDKPETYSYEAS